MIAAYDTYCGKDLGHEEAPRTCMRRLGHNTVCGPNRDRSTDRRFNDAWAEYFARHPEVLASWSHQHDYWPPGYNEFDDRETGSMSIPAEKPRPLSCGWCFEEDGEEVHPHPECPIGAREDACAHDGTVYPEHDFPPEGEGNECRRCGAEADCSEPDGVYDGEIR